MKSYLVPFVAEETVWNDCVARVEANSKEEAFLKVQKSIEESNPFIDFNASWNGINTVTTECVETEQYAIGDEYNTTVEDVKEDNEDISCELAISALDIAQYGDELYKKVEEKFLENNLDIDIRDMNLTPIGIDGDLVNYKVIPTEYVDRKSDEVIKTVCSH